MGDAKPVDDELQCWLPNEGGFLAEKHLAISETYEIYQGNVADGFVSSWYSPSLLQPPVIHLH